MQSKSSVSNAGTYQEIGSFWDEHDATEFGEQTDAEFDVNMKSQRRYFPVDSHLSSVTAPVFSCFMPSADL